MKKLRKIQRGLSLVTAIFLLVVLASLGAVMMTFFTAQEQSSALDVLGSRAYQAARAGIEWGAYQVLQNGGACAASTVVPLAGTLSGFTVTVTCNSTAYSDVSTASGTVTIYSIAAVATRATPGQPDYVERQISVTLSN
jgi:MSHA biogenesis protein MshP